MILETCERRLDDVIASRPSRLLSLVLLGFYHKCSALHRKTTRTVSQNLYWF